jgi:hypothetical protein
MDALFVLSVVVASYGGLAAALYWCEIQDRAWQRWRGDSPIAWAGIHPKHGKR